MDAEEELDTHICLKCQKTIIGLDNYVAHKRMECPNLPIKPGSQEKLSKSAKETNDPSPQENVPANEPPRQLKSDDFFLSLELKSSRAVEQKVNQSHNNDDDPKSAELESMVPAEEFVENAGFDDLNSSEKGSRAEQKGVDFMSIGGEDEEGEFEDDDDYFEDDDCPPREHTGGKWKPGMRLENSMSWLSTLPQLPNMAGGTLTPSTELAKKRTPKAYLRGATCKCEPCNVTFAKESGLVSHLASSEHWVTSGNHPLHKHLILSHVEALAPLSPFKCSICAFYFNDYKELVIHWAKEDETHKAKVGQYRQLVCTSCKYRCWTTEEMLEHLINLAHKQGVSCWSPVEVAASSELCCSKCNWTCGRQQALFSHMRWKHSNNIHCPKCRINFSSEAALDHHNSMNEHVIKGYDCSFCPFVGESKSSVAAHSAQEHPKTAIKGTAKKSRCRPSLEESKKSKSNEELNDIDTYLGGKNKEACIRTSARSLLKPMPLTVKNRMILNRMRAGNAAVANSDGNISQFREKLGETAVGDLSDLPLPEIQVKQGAESKDHTYYETGLSSPGKEERELADDYVIKQENLVQNDNELPVKRGRSKACTHCSQIVSDMKRLRTHLLKFHPDQLIRCEPCCATFVLKSEFETHLKGLIHRCNTKDLRDSSERLLNPDKDFACSQCSFRSASKSGIIFHEMLHPRKTEEAISALEDAEMDVREEVLFLEEDQVGSADAGKEDAVIIEIESDGSSGASDTEKPKQKSKRSKCHVFVCPICRKGFSAPNLRDHLNIHTGEKPFVCSICQACFALKGSLASHRRSQHAEKRHACPHCSYRSNRKAKLNEHLSTHEDRVRECTCDICGAGFYKSSALQSHMKLHSEDKGKRVVCTYEGCNKAFRAPSEMVYHYRIHTGDRPFLCETCGYCTKSRHQLTKHERSHNGIKPFKCNYCSYSSSRSAQLRRHMRIHSCTKPYSCPHCSYTSSNQENLRKHVLKSKKHAGLSVYPCRHCPFGCNTANEMRDHMITEHPVIARQFNTDAPAFASLVTGIYNQKGDIKAPINTPAPYVPLTEKRDLYKNLHSKLQARVDNYNLDGEIEEHSKLLDDDDRESACDDATSVFVRVVLEEHVQKAISEQNEVSTAVEYLVESTKRKNQSGNPSLKSVKRHCSSVSDSKECESKGDDALNDNSQLYQLLNQDSSTLYKQEKAVTEEPLDNQNQIAIYAIEFPNDQTVEQIISSDEHEEAGIKETTAGDEQQREYQQNTIILPFDAIEQASTTESEDQTVTIIQDSENFHAVAGTNSDGETVILYMPIM